MSETTTGISEIKHTNKNFIYPNPFSYSTILQTDNILTNAILTETNCFGQTVKQTNNISGQTITLFRDNLPSGMYFIQLMQYNQVITTKKQSSPTNNNQLIQHILQIQKRLEIY